MIVLTLALTALAVGASPDPRLSLLDAMAQELERNRTQLKLDEHTPLYFLSYQVRDQEQYVLAARYGALFEDESYRQRGIYADVRVGTYAFDNSLDEEHDFNFSTKGTSYITRKTGPIDNDPAALRTALWLITDERYKAALFNYLKKKGEDVYAVANPKRPPSFSQESAQHFVQPPIPFSLRKDRWEPVLRKLSARLATASQLFDSDVRVTADKVVRYFVSSEGSRVLTEETLYGVHLTGFTRADDGQLLDDSRDYYSPTEAGLPSDAQLVEAADHLVDELLAIRAAPALDPYTGPAILEPPAAGVLFHEAVGHRLEGDRQDDDSEGKTFKGQVGQRLLPDFITLADDPTLHDWNGVWVNGFYRFDEEGVPATKAVLVDRGVLKGFLLSRHPVEGFLHSNGHGRAQGTRRPVARMANLLVSSTRQVSDERLKHMLIDEAKRQGKPFALIIRDITGGNTNTSSYGYQAFKGIPRIVYKVNVNDGKETLVRGVEIVGTPLASMNRILATGKIAGVFNGFCGAESGMVPVSTIAPPTLLQEIELQRAQEGKDRPPLLPSPSAVTR